MMNAIDPAIFVTMTSHEVNQTILLVCRFHLAFKCHCFLLIQTKELHTYLYLLFQKSNDPVILSDHWSC